MSNRRSILHFDVKSTVDFMRWNGFVDTKEAPSQFCVFFLRLRWFIRTIPAQLQLVVKECPRFFFICLDLFNSGKFCVLGRRPFFAPTSSSSATGGHFCGQIASKENKVRLVVLAVRRNSSSNYLSRLQWAEQMFSIERGYTGTHCRWNYLFSKRLNAGLLIFKAQVESRWDC